MLGWNCFLQGWCCWASVGGVEQWCIAIAEAEEEEEGAGRGSPDSYAASLPQWRGVIFLMPLECTLEPCAGGRIDLIGCSAARLVEERRIEKVRWSDSTGEAED